jgi:hypothetical protein
MVRAARLIPEHPASDRTRRAFSSFGEHRRRVLVALKDAFKGPAVPAGLESSPFLQRRARLLKERLRLLVLEERLSRCMYRISHQVLGLLLEALERPKPRKRRAVQEHRMLAVEVEALYASYLAGRPRRKGPPKQIILDVANKRHVSERKVREAIARYGEAARAALNKRR